jgi:hypothetical protein
LLDPDAAPDLSDLDGPSAGEIAAAIRRLPPNQRAVILLREIQGLSYAEIATELELSLAAVETLIFRARGNLAGELALSDHTPSTRERLARRLRGLLPLPGLGKLSLGFSFGRAGLAAVAGGVAIMTVPVGDVAADPAQPPAVQRTPSFAQRAGPLVSPTSTAPATTAEPTRTVGRHKEKKGTGDDSTATASASDATAGPVSTVQGVVSTVEGVADAAVPLPTVTVPTVTVPSVTVPSVTVPSLPVEPPTLPPPAPLPEVDLSVDLGG